MAPQPLPILTISLSRHLGGRDINLVLKDQWSSPNIDPSTSARFNSQGFNLDVDSVENLKELHRILHETEWAGVIVGWCLRSRVELTELFETVVGLCVDYILEKQDAGSKPKLMFSKGADDIVNTTLRNFTVPE